MTTKTTEAAKTPANPAVIISAGRAAGTALVLTESSSAWLRKMAAATNKKTGKVTFALTRAEAIDLITAIATGYPNAQFSTSQQRGTPKRVVEQLMQAHKITKAELDRITQPAVEPKAKPQAASKTPAKAAAKTPVAPSTTETKK